LEEPRADWEPDRADAIIEAAELGSIWRPKLMQYLVLAYDCTDREAPARRLATRLAHFDGIKPMIEKGEIRAAGAILDDEGNMVGSVVFTEFLDRAALDSWLEREPYMRQGVWHSVEVRPFRIAVLDGKVTP
jgi:uncharacterized protein YciI